MSFGDKWIGLGSLLSPVPNVGSPYSSAAGRYLAYRWPLVFTTSTLASHVGAYTAHARSKMWDSLSRCAWVSFSKSRRLLATWSDGTPADNRCPIFSVIAFIRPR